MQSDGGGIRQVYKRAAQRQGIRAAAIQTYFCCMYTYEHFAFYVES